MNEKNIRLKLVLGPITTEFAKNIYYYIYQIQGMEDMIDGMKLGSDMIIYTNIASVGDWSFEILNPEDGHEALARQLEEKMNAQLEKENTLRFDFGVELMKARRGWPTYGENCDGHIT
jgi:hypothetical protein